jgi:membrane-bound lytic murein transglycosylase D
MNFNWLIHKTVCCLVMIAVLRGENATALPIPFELFSEAEPREFRIQIPVETNREIQRWIHFYTRKDRERFARFMKRGALYKTLIQDILIEHRVPGEMYYLAMIESGFARRARSSAKAVGVWQFMPATARLYGLRVDREVDERLDLIRSTRAAARYLKDLKQEFGSWYLAMAAYNCGLGRMRRAVNRHQTRNFWRLARRDAIPDETANYIPKFQAAMIIARSPERYGFARNNLYDFPEVRRVRIAGRTQLREIARRHRVSITSIVSLNPHLLRGRTPRTSYEVWIPREPRG